MDDTYAGRNSIVIADDMEKAINLFKKAYTTFLERVRELSADGETLIIQGIQEPEYRVQF